MSEAWLTGARAGMAKVASLRQLASRLVPQLKSKADVVASKAAETYRVNKEFGPAIAARLKSGDYGKVGGIFKKHAGEEQTRGEFEAATSSPGHGATQFTGMVDRTERRSGNQGHRGVPEWLRRLMELPGQTTWSGGDRIGPQRSDNQFDTPLAGGK